MSILQLTPTSQTSRIVLPPTGSIFAVAAQLPIGVPQYVNDISFLSGAADQVAYTYKRLGGDVLDLEITTGSVYAAYEEAVLEYSSMINNHQARNVLADVLGLATGTFDQDGELKAGTELSSSLSGGSLSLMYPNFDLRSVFDVSRAISQEANVGGMNTVYSASFAVAASKQDYDLQAIVEAAAGAGGELYSNALNGNRITIRRIWYKTPRAMWRFYGYYGGLNSVGNLSTYGQYSDDSTFEVIPAWQNKLQAMAYEDNLWTRISHYSYEIRNNRLRVYPMPESSEIQKMWFEFTIGGGDVYGLNDPTNANNKRIKGVNNVNTIPFANIPYCNINSMGKQWIRKYALAIAKETLGQVRSKIATIPIPGESVTLNGPQLVQESIAEQERLRTELAEYLDKVTYTILAEQRAELVENSERVNQKVPMAIFVG